MVQFQLKKLLLIVGLLISSLSIYSQGLPRIRFTQIQQDTTFGSVLVSSPTDSNITYSRNFYITSDNILRFYNDTIPIKFYVDSVDATKVNTNLNNVTGVLPVANGGTGATTLTGAGIVTGTGTTNYLPKFTGSTTVANSNLINNASGNLGLGVTPSAWASTHKALEMNWSAFSTDAGNGETSVSTNAYASATRTWNYRSTAPAARYTQDYYGWHLWYTAPSGTAGNAISFTQAMTLDASGNLGIGTTSPQRTLDVIGSSNGTPAASFGRALPIGNWSGIHFGYSEAGNSSYRKSAIVFERTGSAAEGKIHILNNGAADISSATLADARLTILPAGNVGIGTTEPSEKLHVVGNARITAIGSGAFSAAVNQTSNGTLTTQTSDLRLKTNFRQLDGVLDKLMNVNTYYFNWLEETSKDDIGMIAQEVEQIFPLLTFTNNVDGYKGIHYNRFDVVLTKAIQEQQVIIESQKTEIEQLKTQYNDLLQRIINLENK